LCIFPNPKGFQRELNFLLIFPRLLPFGFLHSLGPQRCGNQEGPWLIGFLLPLGEICGVSDFPEVGCSQAFLWVSSPWNLPLSPKGHSLFDKAVFLRRVVSSPSLFWGLTFSFARVSMGGFPGSFRGFNLGAPFFSPPPQGWPGWPHPFWGFTPQFFEGKRSQGGVSYQAFYTPRGGNPSFFLY